MSGIGTGGWMGSGGKESNDKVITEATTQATEQNVQLGGSAQNFISPGAVVSGGGSASILASPKATVNAEISYSGFSGADVQSLLNNVFAEGAQDRAIIGSLAESVAGVQASQQKQLTDIIAATKSPEYSTLTSLMPLLIVGALIFLLKGR